MSVRTFTSRSFTRNVGAAKRAAAKGPVFITERGRPAFALLKIEHYYQLAGQQQASLLDVMDAIPSGAGIEFEPPRSQVSLRASDLG